MQIGCDVSVVTTKNLLSVFIVQKSGDRAVPHRHTAAAIRFSTRAEGAATIVNGRRCDMLPGDPCTKVSTKISPVPALPVAATIPPASTNSATGSRSTTQSG